MALRGRSLHADLQTLAGWVGQKIASVPRKYTHDPAVEAARLATYPPPYPEGWYVVALERDIKDRPQFVQVAGHAIALFRGASGRVFAVDAYCPHMGANLADGHIEDDCIRCPFHGWKIAGDGCVKELAGRQRPTDRHRTNAWSVDLFHGWVCVYHVHRRTSQGAVPVPRYQLEHMKEIDSGKLVHRGDHDAGPIQMHLLEFVENSVDFQHFDAIHGQLRFPWTDVPIPGMTVSHDARWQRDQTDPHVAWFINTAQLLFRGKPIPGTGAEAKIRLDGPGGVVRFDLDLNKGGRVVLFQSHTPVKPLTQRVRFRWFSEPSVSPARASFIVGNWVSQWRRDISIWERKIFRRTPLLQRGDGPIMQLRRWYAQFYPDPDPERTDSAPSGSQLRP